MKYARGAGLTLLAAIIGAWVVGAHAQGKPQMPAGWRLPTAVETEAAWRNKDPDRYLLVRADLDDDGKRDEAQLLVDEAHDLLGLFVFMSGSESPKGLLLDKAPKKMLAVFGIKAVPPGKYTTACGKGYFDCKPGDSPEVQLKTTGLGYFKFESAESVFVWDSTSRQFKRIWLSD